MSLRILRMQPSERNLDETKLCIEGIVTKDTPDYAKPFDMVIEFYQNDEDLMPTNTILVANEHHFVFINEYGIDALLDGVVSKESVMDILKKGLTVDELFEKEAEKIAANIIAQFEKDTLFDNYNPGKLREYIENKIMDLKEKFIIQEKKL